jgi:oligopeptide/dipeptide ABC transporter ATP-binding protein
MPETNDSLLCVEDLRVYFRSEDETARAVDGVSFDVRSSETVCIVGESGCGKTVTALSILGLVPTPPGVIAGGIVLYRNRNLLELDDIQMQHIRGNQIAMVFQEPQTSLNPVFTVGEQIGETIRAHEQASDTEVRERSIRLLKNVELPSPADRLGDYPHQLSGGQRQRAMIAMALACNPDLIIADEPTTALDVTVQAQILNLINGIQKERDMSVLYITHDLGVVSRVADRVYVMYAGIIAETGHRDHIFTSPRHPYTQALLASLPTRKKRGEQLYSIPGTVPNPAYKPQGCPFHPRCSEAVSTCRIDYPDMCDYGDGHRARCPIVFEKNNPGI